VFADFDYRQPLNPRQGGWYRIERTHHSDRTTGQFTFDRTDIDLRQYLGFFNGRRVIALRGVYSTTDVAADHEVPFYYMPWLGGRDTLRGFKNYRFRAPHSLLMQAEYRWEIWSGLDGALFYDTGKVAMTRKDIDLSGLVHAYGIGLRFNTNAGVVLRFDFAFANDEGMRLHMNAGPAF
jgi:outer membrane protein assembly factor BamA